MDIEKMLDDANHYMGCPTTSAWRPEFATVCGYVKDLVAEVDRLKRGDFTPEEFQHLCHHRDEKPGCTRHDFEQGCREYQGKLFGVKPPRTVQEALEECKKWELTEEEVEGMLR